jgi:hypothetical protein
MEKKNSGAAKTFLPLKKKRKKTKVTAQIINGSTDALKEEF